jgi:hypothetical protein
MKCEMAIYGAMWWGNWSGIQNKYIGVRFRLERTTYFGWIRVSVDEDEEKVTVHDMAYSRIELTAGATNAQ